VSTCSICGGTLERSEQYPDAGYLHRDDRNDTHVPQLATVIEQPAAVVEIRVPASVYAELTDEERMFTVDGDRFIVTVDPDASES
jgi:hypothetical protein